MEKTRFYPGEKGKDAVVDYNEPQKSASFEYTAEQVEFSIGKQIGTMLCKVYPNRHWHVDVDVRNEVIVIGCPSLSKTLGYRMHTRCDSMPELLNRAKMAAGEILERYNVTRARVIDPAMFDDMPRDVRDDVIAPDAKTSLH